MLHRLLEIKKIALLLVVMLLAACTNSQLPGEENTNGLAEVVLTLRIPQDASRIATRAGGESVIDDINILVFEAKGDNTGKLLEVAKWYNKTETGTGADLTVKLSVSLSVNGTYNLVVLGNAADVLNEALSDNDITPGISTKAEVMAALEVSQTGEWNINTQSIPLCGEVASVAIGDIGSSVTPLTVELVRMLAKVEVDVSGLDKKVFDLTGVFHCNYVTGGLIIPDLTLPSNKPTLSETRIVATKAQEHTPGADGKLTFYTFESAAIPEPSDGTWKQGHCLVLKGNYRGADTESFYRVDFYDDVTGARVPVLRNKHYQVTINEVHTSGHPSLAAALNSVSNTFPMKVTDWVSGGDIGYIDKNPVYKFNINGGDPIVLGKGEKKEVVLVSSSPYTWEITWDPADALDVSPTTGTGYEPKLILTAGNTAKPVRLTVTINNANFTSKVTIK